MISAHYSSDGRGAIDTALSSKVILSTISRLGNDNIERDAGPFDRNPIDTGPAFSRRFYFDGLTFKIT